MRRLVARCLGVVLAASTGIIACIGDDPLPSTPSATDGGADAERVDSGGEPDAGADSGSSPASCELEPPYGTIATLPKDGTVDDETFEMFAMPDGKLAIFAVASTAGADATIHMWLVSSSAGTLVHEASPTLPGSKILWSGTAAGSIALLVHETGGAEGQYRIAFVDPMTGDTDLTNTPTTTKFRGAASGAALQLKDGSFFMVANEMSGADPTLVAAHLGQPLAGPTAVSSPYLLTPGGLVESTGRVHAFGVFGEPPDAVEPKVVTFDESSATLLSAPPRNDVLLLGSKHVASGQIALAMFQGDFKTIGSTSLRVGTVAEVSDSFDPTKLTDTGLSAVELGLGKRNIEARLWGEVPYVTLTMPPLIPKGPVSFYLVDAQGHVRAREGVAEGGIGLAGENVVAASVVGPAKLGPGTRIPIAWLSNDKLVGTQEISFGKLRCDFASGP